MSMANRAHLLLLALLDALGPLCYVPLVRANEVDRSNSVEIGSLLYFGRFPQSSGYANPEPILWRVLEVNNNEVLLLSEYILTSL